MLAAGEVVAPSIPLLETVMRLGALGVLMVVAYFLFQEMRSQRKENTATMNVLYDRWNGWEKIRHEDSNKLDETLRMMTANCEKTRAEMKSSRGAKNG